MEDNDELDIAKSKANEEIFNTIKEDGLCE